MSDLSQILLTSSLTIIGGLVIFSLTRLMEVVYIKPISNLNSLRGNVASLLILHRNKFGNTDLSKTILEETSNELRSIASELRSKVYLVKNHKLLTKVGLLLPKEDFLEASSELIGLSNTMFRNEPDTIQNRIEKIEDSLKISV